MRDYKNHLKIIFIPFLLVSAFYSLDIDSQTRSQLDIISALGDIPTGIKSSSNIERNNKQNEATSSQGLINQQSIVSETQITENCRVSGNVTYCYAEDQKEVAFECKKAGSSFNCIEIDESGKLKKYGYDIFRSSPSTFAPATFIPVSEGYLIGPGDTIDILMYGSMDEYYSLIVNRDGAIDFPLLGPINVSGITFSDMKETVTQVIESELVGVKSSISLGKLKSITVFVLGDAKKPGSYTISSLSTLTNAIFASGGVNEIGSLRNIEIRRNGSTLNEFDLYDFLLYGDNSKDSRLQNGDVIFIPPAKRQITVAGSVNRPAIYELKNENTLNQIINLAGGLKSDASLQTSTLKKANSLVNAYEIVSLKSSSKKISFDNGDRIDFGRIKNEVVGSVKLSGYIQDPTFFEFNEEMRLSDVFQNDSSLLPYTDIEYALLISKSLPSSKIKVRSFSIENIISDASVEDNYSLKPNDEIVIFHNSSYKTSNSQSNNNSDINPSEQIEEDEDQKTYDTLGARETSLEFASNFETIRPGINKDRRDEKPIDRKTLLEPIIKQLLAQADVKNPAKTIEVNGAVHFPGIYPLTEDMKLNDLVYASGGLLDSSYAQNVEITRVVKTGTKDEFDISRQEVNLSKDASFNLPLKSRSTVFIRAFPISIRTVNISGEVKFPGEYTIGANDTLSELIIRAGGYTDKAFSKGIVFTRESLKLLEEQRMEELRQNLKKEIVFASESAGTEKIDLASLQSLLEDATNSNSLGRLVVDVDSILSGSQSDITLMNNDQLQIPQRPESVNVIGEVYYPAFHLHSENISVSEYIQMSGGLTTFANDDSIYVIKADGSVRPLTSSGGFFRRSTSKEIEVGDTIIVPVQVDLYSGIRAATDISQVIYQLAITAAAVNSLSN